MQEVVQAIEDEENKEKKRELSEIENFEKKELLKEIKKANREERRKGKLYIEALQRDQEVNYRFSFPFTESYFSSRRLYSCLNYGMQGYCGERR